MPYTLKSIIAIDFMNYEHELNPNLYHQTDKNQLSS